jgi:hypothetical protein
LILTSIASNASQSQKGSKRKVNFDVHGIFKYILSLYDDTSLGWLFGLI